MSVMYDNGFYAVFKQMIQRYSIRSASYNRLKACRTYSEPP